MAKEKRYWKEALLAYKQELDQRPDRWSAALRQAQADLASPTTVVWFGQDAPRLLHQAPADVSPSQPFPLRKLLLFVGPLLLLAGLRYLRAYRRMSE